MLSQSANKGVGGDIAMARPVVVSPTPVAHRLTLLCLLVYIGKIGDILPFLGTIHIGKVLIGAAVAALIIEGGGWWHGLFQNRIVKPFLWIVAIVLITAPLGIWRGNSADYLIGTYFKDVVLVFLLLATLQTKADIRRALWMYVISVMVLAYALLIYGIGGIGQFSLGRNEVAMVCVLALALLLPLEAKGLTRFVKWAGIAVLITTVLLSQSRGSYLGLLVVVPLYIYLKVGKRMAVTAVVFGLIAYAVYVNLPADVTGRAVTIVNYEEDYNFTAPEGRIEVWKNGLQMIQNDPLTGVGIWNFTIAEGLMHRDRGGRWMNAHNALLQVAAELGLVGAAAFIVLLVRVYGTSRQLMRSRSRTMSQFGFALLLAAIGYFITGFFLSAGYAVIFYVIVALTAAAHRVASRDQEVKDVVSA